MRIDTSVLTQVFQDLAVIANFFAEYLRQQKSSAPVPPVTSAPEADKAA